MSEDELGKKKRVVVESLGWLTESSIMPNKHRAIAGVGPSSILELKTQLYKSQEEAKTNNPDKLEVHRPKKKITPHHPFAGKNSGVDVRPHNKTLVKEEIHQPNIIAENESGKDSEPDTKPTGLGMAVGTVDNDEHRRFVREVHEEVNEAREKVSELKVRRQEQVAVRREKLKQAYLRKELEKLKAQSK